MNWALPKISSKKLPHVQFDVVLLARIERILDRFLNRCALVLSIRTEKIHFYSWANLNRKSVLWNWFSGDSCQFKHRLLAQFWLNKCRSSSISFLFNYLRGMLSNTPDNNAIRLKRERVWKEKIELWKRDLTMLNKAAGQTYLVSICIT